MAHKRGWSRKRLVLNCLSVAIFYIGCGSDGTAPRPSEALNAEGVKKLYNTKCGICHGSDGTMQYAGSKDLSVSTMSLEAVHEQIKYGKGTMPPMNKVLDDATIGQLAEYALTLRKP